MTDVPQVVCVVSPRTHTDTIRSVYTGPTYTRVYPGDADDVVAGRARPVQGELTVEVDRVYLIADKDMDLTPSYSESNSRSPRNPPEPGESSTLY